MKKLIALSCAAAVLLIAAAFLLKTPSAPENGETLVALNEIDRLVARGDAAEAAGKIAALRAAVGSQTAVTDHRGLILCGICLLFLAAETAYFCIAVIRPFEKLSHFADEIAKGNFDLPLNYERTNYFGKFTWGFDRMRREISNARAREREAAENHKTVIASLSHDIKTPVATVRACAEALQLGIAQDSARQEQYLETMLHKCDEITKLTDDMLLHSLSDLERLHMRPQTFDLIALVAQTVRDLSAGKTDIHFEKPLFAASVTADPVRTAQVLENLIHNARKYAKTDITVSVTRDGDYFTLHVSDTGGGIPDADLPFICERFRRGSNAGKEPGAGLGLSIVKYIAEQSGGRLSLENRDGGLCASVSLPCS